MPHADIKKLPIGTTNSAVEKFRKQFFYKRKAEDQSMTKLQGASASDTLIELEFERSKAQLEIKKLIFAISDEGVPLTQEEVMEINDSINRWLQLKYVIENDIFKMTRGERDYIPTELKGNTGQYKYFGRAKPKEVDVTEGGAAVAAGLVELRTAEVHGPGSWTSTMDHATVEKAMKKKDEMKESKRTNVFDLDSDED